MDLIMTIVPIPGESPGNYILRARRTAEGLGRPACGEELVSTLRARDTTHSMTDARRTTMPTEHGGKHVSVDAPAGADADEIAKAFQAFRQKKLAEKRAREEAERMKSEGATTPLGEP